jgi:glycolate oxidase FAD binding subunit
VARRSVGARTRRVSGTASVGDTEAIAARVRDARDRREPLRIVGARQWLDAGRPCDAAGSLDVGALRGVIEFAPDDFTISVRAGTSLAEIDEIAASAARWLTLRPFGSAAGTIGATVATASWGPLASAFGTPRDHVLGCEVVTGRGDVIRAGGRVVKNVAGFDLVRLMTGAWGTLGVLTEVTVRLRARPEVDRTIAVAIEGTGPEGYDAVRRWLRASAFTPLAAELCSPALAARLGVSDGAQPVLLVRLGGNEPLVRAAAQSIAEVGVTRDVDAGLWEALRVAEPAGATTFRLGAAPASLGPVWTRAVRDSEGAGGWAHATVARGVVRCVVPVAEGASDEDFARLRGMIAHVPSAGSRIVERAPASIWAELPPAAADALSVGVRRAFDPDGILNPGILGPIA